MSEEITVVIVDDEAASVRNLSNDLCVYSDVRILETTTSVEKARKIVIRQQPDLLFLDVEMPKMSGLDLWQNIRADVHADMRVVFYTAYDKYVLEALRASAFDYLLKPYLPEELDAVIERFRCVFYRSRVNMEQSMRRLLADDCKFAIQTVTGLLFFRREPLLAALSVRPYGLQTPHECFCPRFDEHERLICPNQPKLHCQSGLFMFN